MIIYFCRFVQDEFICIVTGNAVTRRRREERERKKKKRFLLREQEQP